MVSNENSNLEELKKSIENIGFDIAIDENELIFEISTKFTKNILANSLSNMSCSGSLNKNNSVLEPILQLVVEKVLNINFEGATRSEVDQKEMLDKQPNENGTKQETMNNTVDVSSKRTPEIEGVEKTHQKEDHKNMSLDVPPIPGMEDTSYQSNNSSYKEEQAPPPPGENTQQQKEKSSKKPEAPPEEKNEDGIKDVQILAINTQLELNKADYKELVSEAFTEAGIQFDEVPPLEQLTYKQAIEVIKYGNRKFKK